MFQYGSWNTNRLNRKHPLSLWCAHDGWTGEVMAKFCEALAETAVVTEASRTHAYGCEHCEHSAQRLPSIGSTEYVATKWQHAIRLQ